MNAWRIWVRTPIILAVSACATAPAYIAPSLPTPTGYVAGPAIEARGAPGNAVDLVKWWNSFGDPLLTSLVERSIAQNLDLQEAEARVVQARAAMRHAGADLLPSGQVSGQAGANYQSLKTPLGKIASSSPGYDRTSGSFEAGLGGSWELDVFGGKDAARDAARADWQASQAAAVAVRLAIIAQTADTYIQIRALQQRLEIARAQVLTQDSLTQLIALQFRKGLAAELQLRQSEGALQQVRATVPALQNQLDIAMNALDVMLGELPGTTRAELATVRPVPRAPALTTAGGPTELLRRRPDIIAAERSLAASNSRIGVAVSEYYPKFSLSGLIGFAAGAPGALLSGRALQGQGVLGLHWRLFDFQRIDAEIMAAKGRKVEALIAYRRTVLRASQDVEDSFSILIQQEARADDLLAGETSLSRAQQSANAAYRAGMVSLIDVLDAERRLLETRDGVVQARAAAGRGAVASFRALGGGWDGTSQMEQAPHD